MRCTSYVPEITRSFLSSDCEWSGAPATYLFTFNLLRLPAEITYSSCLISQSARAALAKSRPHGWSVMQIKPTNGQSALIALGVAVPTKPDPSSKEGLLLAEASDGNAFLNRVEKHIDDLHKNRGYLSKDVARDIGVKQIQIGEKLGSGNVKAFSDFLGYSSGLRYDRRARFVAGVNQTTSKMDQFSNRADQDALTQELIKIYENRGPTKVKA